MSGPESRDSGGGSRRDFAVASLQTFLGSTSSRVLIFVFAIVAARVLGTESYGEFAILQSTAMLLALAIGQPLSVVSNRYAAALRVDDAREAARLARSLITATVVGSLVAVAGLLVGSTPLATYLFSRPALAPYMAVVGLIVMLQSLFLVVTGTLRGFERFKTAANAHALQGFIGVPLALAAVWIWNLWGAVAGLAAFWAIGAGLATVGLLRLSTELGTGLRPKLDTDHLRSIWPFYFPYLLTVLFVALSYWGVRTILTHGPDAYHQVGLFSAAFQYGQVTQLIIGPLLMVGAPMLTSAWSRSDPDRFRQTISDLVKVSYILLIPLSLIGAGCAPWLLALLGSGYEPALRSTEILFIALGLNAFLALIGPVLIAMERGWSLAALSVLRGGLLLLLTFMLRDRGALGGATALLVTEVIMAVALLICFSALREFATIKLVGRMLLCSVPGFLVGSLGLLQAGTVRALITAAAAAIMALGAWFALGRADQAGLLRLLGRLTASVRK